MCRKMLINLLFNAEILFGFARIINMNNNSSPLDSHGCSFFHSPALRIHISQATKQILDDLGGFEVEERGEVFLKVRK